MRHVPISMVGALAALVSLLVSPAVSFTVSPTQIELVSIGNKSRSIVTVVNGSDQPMAIETVVKRMSLDETGKATTTNAGDEFLLMPPMALIPPGRTQNFRVQWLGDPQIDASQSFYLYFNQVPVKMPVGHKGVQVVVGMGVMVNVAPASGAPQLRVVGTGIEVDKTGKRRPTLTVHNPSKVHALLPTATVRLASQSWSQTLPSGLLSEHIGSGLVQPGKRRKFILPVDLPREISGVQASIEMQPQRR
jgi:fimbrial chaperone protein